MKTKHIYFFSLLSLFVSSVVFATDATVGEIADVDEYVINQGDSVTVTGVWHSEGGYGGSVTNVGTLTVNGTFISDYTETATSQFDAQILNGSGNLNFVSYASISMSPELDMLGFNGNISIYSEGKTPSLNFSSSKSSPSSANFDIGEGASVIFTNGDYTLNGSISGAGTIQSYKTSITTPANVTIRGDISGFSGNYVAIQESSIKLETSLADAVSFKSALNGSLELIGKAGDAKKTIEVSSAPSSTTTGNVYMYGNTPVIKQNANEAGQVLGTVFLGGNNSYTQSEKVEYTLNSTTVLGSTAGNIVAGGNGAGSIMAKGSNIVVDDNVTIGTLTAGGINGATVNGDVAVTVNSGNLQVLKGGVNATHTGNTSITVNGGNIDTIYGGDELGGKVNGDVTINVAGGAVNKIYGSSYSDSTGILDFNGMTGNIQINVSGGQVNHIRGGITGSISGSGLDVKEKMVLNGNVEINISGDAVVLDDGGGESILGTGGSYGSINGDVTINVSDRAVINGIVAAGASRGDTGGVKNTYVNISGGTLKGDVYAGGLKVSTVTGSTNVVISGGEIIGNVYGSGGKETYVNNDTNITVTGDAVISGTISGTGINNISDDVKGSKNLAVENYTADTTLKVANFDTLAVENTKNLNLEGALALDTLTIDTVSSITLSSGSSIDSYSLVFSHEFGEGDFLDLSFFENIKIGEETIVLSSLAEENISQFSVVDSAGKEFKLVMDGESFAVGIAVPEPAEWAVIFGVIVLGFVAYSRKQNREERV